MSLKLIAFFKYNKCLKSNIAGTALSAVRKFERVLERNSRTFGHLCL